MEINIQIDESFAPSINPESIEEAIATTVRFCNSFSGLVKACSISVVITDNDTIRAFNRQYRDIDAPTDVLSFQNPPDPEFPNALDHLGDIIIAYPVAEVQAQIAGHTALEEIILLTVHGVLHLFGFHHDTPATKNKMWAIQRQIMTELGLAHIQPTVN